MSAAYDGDALMAEAPPASSSTAPTDLRSDLVMSKHSAKKLERQNKRTARGIIKRQEQEAVRAARHAHDRLEALEYCRIVLTQDRGDVHESSVMDIRALIFLQYSGTNYKGVQLQNRSQIRTIEGDLLHALYRAGGISSDPRFQLSWLGWQRTARTDMGVHAAFNIVACHILHDGGLIARANALLPEAIRILDIIPSCPVPADPAAIGVTSAEAMEFHAKNSCTGRVYEYLMPSAVWGLHSPPSSETVEQIKSQIAKLASDKAAAAGTQLSPLDMIPTKVLHRLLSTANKALTALRGGNSQGFTVDGVGEREAKMTALASLKQDLPQIFTHLRVIRRKLHSLTKDLGPFRENLERDEAERTSLLEKIETEERMVREGSGKTSAMAITDSAAGLTAPSSTASPSFACTTSSSSSPPLTPPALLLSTWLSQFHTACAEPPPESDPFFELPEFMAARLDASQVEKINSVLGRYEGQFIDFRNFTKALEKAIKSVRERTKHQQTKGEKVQKVDEAQSASSSSLSVASSPLPSPSPSPSSADLDASPDNDAEGDDAPGANYTRRTIFECKIFELCVRNGVEYCRIRIAGQSFMLNQIRKMLGLVVLVMRGMCEERIFETVFDAAYDYDIPAAPARGLLLCGASFHRYERLCAATKPVEKYSIEYTLTKHKQEIDAFKSSILETEICAVASSHAAYRMWLTTLEPPKLLSQPNGKEV